MHFQHNICDCGGDGGSSDQDGNWEFIVMCGNAGSFKEEWIDEGAAG